MVSVEITKLTSCVFETVCGEERMASSWMRRPGTASKPISMPFRMRYMTWGEIVSEPD